MNQSAHVCEAVETGAESKCGRNVDKDPSGDKTGKADDPGRDCGWRRRLRLSIERPGQCQSQDMLPAVVCFLRIPLHSWVYCLLTEAKEPVARESMSIADDGKELGQTGGTTAVVTVATVSWPSRLTPVSGPIGTGAMGSFQKLIHLHALPWPRGIVNHNGDNVMAKGPPSPSPPSPPIPMLDRSADGMHPARGGSFASSGAKTCLKGPEILLVV